MEYCPNGDLFSMIKKSGKFQPELTRYFFHQLLNGLENIHQSGGVAHLDLKLENLLLDSNFTLKICDFGFIEYLFEPCFTNKGSHGYKAPEIYTFESNTYITDFG